MSKWTIGVIGGSGLYEMEGLEDAETLAIDTPWGAPSDALVRGRIGDVTLVFLPRHGKGHRLTPGAVSYFPGHRGSAIEAPDLHALRIAIISSEENQPSDPPEKQARGASDSLDRRIGREPIPLKWLS